MGKGKHRVIGLWLFFLALPAFAVECTTVSVTAKSLTQRGNALVSTATISFVGDTITETKEFVVNNGQAEVLDIAFKACAVMASNAGITVGIITPTALIPAPVEVAIANAQEARIRLRNLNAYQLESGKADTGTLGASGITFTQARAALINGNASTNGAEEDITNAARLAVFLEQVR